MRRALRYLGFLAAAAFISWVLLRNFREIPAIDLHSVSAWGALTAALALYLAILLVAGLGWRLLQQSYGQSPGLLQAQSQLLIAQFGKYLPGNFAHFLGRIGLAVQDGASATGSGLALIAETALTILAGIAVAIAGLWLMPELRTTLGATMPQRPDHAIAAAVVLAVVVLALLGGYLLHRLRAAAAPPRWPDAPGRFAAAFLAYVANFVLLGLSLWLIAKVAAPSDALPVTLAVIVFAAAWIAGLLTPGAPGGLGVREGIITLGLGVAIGEPAALATALLHRGVSVFGDVLGLGLGWIVRQPRDREI